MLADVRHLFRSWRSSSRSALASVAQLETGSRATSGGTIPATADFLRLFIGGPPPVYVLMFGAVCVLLRIYMQYTRYVAVLKWITLSLLSYFGAVLMVDVRWGELSDAILNPRIVFDKDHLMMIVAMFGVALSPSVVFWQSSQEAEDQRVRPKREPLVEAPEQAPKALAGIAITAVW